MVSVLTVKLYAPWVHSLKEKRMIVQSVLGKVKNKFNVSAVEAGGQDTHQSILLGFVFAAADSAQADSITGHLIDYLHTATDAEILDTVREIR